MLQRKRTEDVLFHWFQLSLCWSKWREAHASPNDLLHSTQNHTRSFKELYGVEAMIKKFHYALHLPQFWSAGVVCLIVGRWSANIGMRRFMLMLFEIIVVIGITPSFSS
jgi:hypothetical protein